MPTNINLRGDVWLPYLLEALEPLETREKRTIFEGIKAIASAAPYLSSPYVSEVDKKRVWEAAFTPVRTAIDRLVRPSWGRESLVPAPTREVETAQPSKLEFTPKERPKTFAPAPKTKAFAELPPPLSSRFGLEEVAQPPLREQRFAFPKEPRIEALSKEELDALRDTLTNMGIPAEEFPDIALQAAIPGARRPETVSKAVAEATKLAEALGVPETERRGFIRFQLGDKSELNVPEDVIEVDRIIAASRAKFPGVTDYEIGKRVVQPTDPAAFAKWTSYREPLIRLEEQIADRRQRAKEIAEAKVAARQDTKADRQVLVVTRALEAVEKQARERYETFLGRLQRQADTWNKNHPEEIERTYRDMRGYLPWDDWYERGEGKRFFDKVKALEKQRDSLLELQSPTKAKPSVGAPKRPPKSKRTLSLEERGLPMITK